MRKIPTILSLILMLSAVPAVTASELMMERVNRPFPETMNALQETIRASGYTVSRVQRVDVGLTSSGFKTAEYRIVFLGKPEEIRQLAARYPELIPYLPFQIVIFAEGEDTILLAMDPRQLGDHYRQPELAAHFERFAKDLQTIITQVVRQGS